MCAPWCAPEVCFCLPLATYLSCRVLPYGRELLTLALLRGQVSGYLKKQMVAAEGSEGAEDVKKMLEEHDKLVDEIFQHEDKDKNGFISHDEFSGPKHDEL